MHTYVHHVHVYTAADLVALRPTAHGSHAIVPRASICIRLARPCLPLPWLTWLAVRRRRYAGGYHDFSPTVRDFWAVLNDFDREERGLFLKFVTSCSKPPLLGFAHLQPPFMVQCVAGDGNEVPSVLAFFGMGRKETDRLPTSATCFNLLKLPKCAAARSDGPRPFGCPVPCSPLRPPLPLVDMQLQVEEGAARQAAVCDQVRGWL